MPIQIDRMDTAVEILPDGSTAGSTGGDRRAPASDAAIQSALRETVGRVMADELDRFLRNRGM